MCLSPLIKVKTVLCNPDFFYSLFAGFFFNVSFKLSNPKVPATKEDSKIISLAILIVVSLSKNSLNSLVIFMLYGSKISATTDSKIVPDRKNRELMTTVL